MSGVVFTVKENTAHAELGKDRLYFCCQGCAEHFEANRERILKARGLAEP